MEALKQPSIHLWGVKIMEPVTTFTDMLVAITCFLGFWLLYRHKIKGKTAMYMKLYFLTMGLATVLGGIIGHAFLYAFSFAWKLPGWYTSMIAIALIERSAIQHVRQHIKPLYGNILLVVNVVELATFMTITALTLNFHFVEIHSVYGLMVVVFSLHLYSYKKDKDRGSKLFMYSIAWVAGAAFVFNYPVSLHKWLNHNDLAHILMIIGSATLIKATFNLKEVRQQVSNEKIKWI